YAVGRSLRLAAPTSELPVSTMLATAVAAAAAVWLMGAGGGTGWSPPPAYVVVVSSALGVIYVFGPVLLVALVRAGRWRVAEALVKVFYLTANGRHALGRLLAQAALQVGDTVAARELSGTADPLVSAQTMRLERGWRGVLELGTSRAEGGTTAGAQGTGAGRWAGVAGASVREPAERPPALVGNEWLLAEARIEALIELDRLPEAQDELRALEAEFDASPAAQ